MANRPIAKQGTTINRSNQDIALELTKAALAGGALASTIGANRSDSTPAALARIDAVYLAALYKNTFARLERLEAEGALKS